MKIIHQANLDEVKVSTKKEFNGRLLHVWTDKVRLPNGKITTREIIKHPGAVAILGITAEQKVILVKQYRYPVGSVLYELPAGKLDKGEDHLVAAEREFSEETGYTAAQWSHLTSIVTTPGFTDEVIHCYLAEGLTKAEQHTDEDEFIDVVELSWQEVKQGILDGTIYDSKSLSAILAYLLRNGIKI